MYVFFKIIIVKNREVENKMKKKMAMTSD